MPIQTAADSISNSAGSPYGFKNRIINGAMVIDQRNVGASVTAANSFVVDRFQVASNASDFTSNRSTVVPSGQPFKNSIYIKPTSTKSPGAGTYAAIVTTVEGFNISDFMWGTAGAKPITLSFWVRSSKIGSYCWGIKNADASRSYSVTYTINSANTWEYKSFTIPGCTDGSWPIDNTRGTSCDFWLAGNNTQSSTKNAWYAGNINMNTDQVNFFDSTSNEFYLTGVQMELGSQATAFDWRDYGTELQLCQRYFQKSFNQSLAVGTTGSLSGSINLIQYVVSGNYVAIPVQLIPQMRATPTMTWYSYVTGATGKLVVSGTDYDVDVQTGYYSDSRIYFAWAANATGNRQILGHYTASAEL